MDRLILMRHAKAERRAASGGDFERRLTEEGRADAALVGRALAKDNLIPAVVLISAAQRTVDTWEAMKAAFPNALEGVTAGTVMLIGHNPGIHELAVGLLREGGAGSAVLGKIASRFPTATAVAFTVDANGRAAYDGVFYAADLGGGGAD